MSDRLIPPPLLGTVYVPLVYEHERGQHVNSNDKSAGMKQKGSSGMWDKNDVETWSLGFKSLVCKFLFFLFLFQNNIYDCKRKRKFWVAQKQVTDSTGIEQWLLSRQKISTGNSNKSRN